MEHQRSNHKLTDPDYHLDQALWNPKHVCRCCFYDERSTLHHDFRDLMWSFSPGWAPSWICMWKVGFFFQLLGPECSFQTMTGRRNTSFEIREPYPLKVEDTKSVPLLLRETGQNVHLFDYLNHFLQCNNFFFLAQPLHNCHYLKISRCFISKHWKFMMYRVPASCPPTQQYIPLINQYRPLTKQVCLSTAAAGWKDFLATITVALITHIYIHLFIVIFHCVSSQSSTWRWKR